MVHKRVAKYHIIIIEMSIRVYNIIHYVTIFINNYSILLSNELTFIVLNHISLLCAKNDKHDNYILDLTVSIVVNGKKFSLAVTMSSVELQYINVLKYTDTDNKQADRNTQRHRDGHEYLIVAVDKPQL